VVEWCKINRKECLFYMKQLKMRRPSAPVKELPLPAGYRYELYSGTREEIEDWKNICKNGLIRDGEDGDYWFQETILKRAGLHPEEDLFFIVDDTDRRIATTAAVKLEDGTGYVHMVASLPETRGKGLGHAMIRHTLSMIEARGVPYTHLTTDDYRLAAIKTYLDAGFLPVICEDPESDMTERWNKVLEDLHYPMVEYLSE